MESLWNAGSVQLSWPQHSWGATCVNRVSTQSRRFLRYCCESDIAVFEWGVTCNYAYSPFKEPNCSRNALSKPLNERPLKIVKWTLLTDAVRLRYADTSLPGFARPPLCSNDHAQYIKMCLLNTRGFFKLVLSLNKEKFQIFRHSGMRGFSKMRSIYQFS